MCEYIDNCYVFISEYNLAMRYIIYIVLLSTNIYGEVTPEDTSEVCNAVITKRLQSNQDAYKQAIDKINQCKKNDIISVTSFLELDTSKVYLSEILQSYCNFDKEIVTLINSDTSQLMCVRIDEARKKVNFIN